jgi:hypothetical protein
MALRIITGARQSSPVVSLEVETNRPPLHLQRIKLALDYVNRFRSLPDHLKVVTELKEDLEDQLILPWTDNTPPPLLVRATKLMRYYNMTELNTAPVPLVGVRPPWETYQEVVPFMETDHINQLPELAVKGLFRERCQP